MSWPIGVAAGQAALSGWLSRRGGTRGIPVAAHSVSLLAGRRGALSTEEGRATRACYPWAAPHTTTHNHRLAHAGLPALAGQDH